MAIDYSQYVSKAGESVAQSLKRVGWKPAPKPAAKKPAPKPAPKPAAKPSLQTTQQNRTKEEDNYREAASAYTDYLRSQAENSQREAEERAREAERARQRAEASRAAMQGIISERTPLMEKYTTWLQNQPSYATQLEQYRTQYGIPAKEEELSGITKQELKVEELLANLESDINTRLQGRAASEPIRRRLYAAEQTPLNKQLSDLSRAEQVASTGLQTSRQSIADLMNAQQMTREQERLGYTEPLTRGVETFGLYGQLTESDRAILSQAVAEQERQRQAIEEAYRNRMAATGEIAQYRTPEQTAAAELEQQRLLKEMESKLSMGEATQEEALREKLAAYEASLKQKTETGDTADKVQKQIYQEISNVPQWQATTEGYRESLINALTALYGPAYKDYISNQVYNYFSDSMLKSLKANTTTTNQWEYDANIWQWLASAGANLSDEEKAQQIKEMGRNPANFGIY